MNIALDYDNTYTASPSFWDDFISLCSNYGHNIFIVTFRDDRYDKDDTLDFFEQNDMNVYYTRGVAKKWWMEQFGEPVSIWIDDKPEAILNNSNMTAEGLHIWREECQKVA